MIFAVVLVVIQMTSATRIPYLCRQGEFFSDDKMECIPCSACPANQALLRACWKNQDTLCGPIGKFEFRQPAIKQSAIATIDMSEHSGPKHKQTVPQSSTVMVANDASGDRWFTITMVLVGILVFMCILGVALLFITCYVCRKKKREIICDPGFTSSLLRPNEEMGIVKLEQLKLVTET